VLRDEAPDVLLRAGFLEEVVVVDGGTTACRAAGVPVVESAQAMPMPLERQVRIAAGGLVFLGTALALAVSLWFAVIPLFVGGGLVYSGVSGTCGLGLLLARMPWNRR